MGARGPRPRDELVEVAFVKAFVVPERRQRIIALLGNRRRKRILSEFPHFRHLDPKFVTPISPRSQSAHEIHRMLVHMGAPSTCYVISADAELDRRHIDLRAALDATVARSGGTVISCIAGVLGYFEGENRGDRVILQRQ